MRLRLHPTPLSYAGLVCLIVLQLAGRASAQTMPLNHPGTAAGAPAGSYALTGFENVNLFNGKLDFHLPLVRIGGRGEAGYTIKLDIQTAWHINRVYQPNTVPFDNPEEYDWGVNPGFSPGIMIGQSFSSYYQLPCGDTGGTASDFVNTMTRLTFKAQNGTSYEFVDKASYGAIQGAQNACGSIFPPQGFNRGRVWVTADGEGMTFIADANLFDFNLNPPTTFYTVSGYLFMSDGTRSRIDNGYVQWMQDRNGNKTTFTYAQSGMQIDDSMGRQIIICYGGGPATYCPTQQGYQSITYKGSGGAARTIKIWGAGLGDTFNGLPTLRADYPLPLKTMSQLFPYPEIVNTQNGNDIYGPGRVAAVEMPDGRMYRFQYNYYGELARVVLPTGGAIEYDWAGAAGNGYSVVQVSDGFTPIIYRRVIKRRVYPNGSTLAGLTEFSLTGGTVDHKEANDTLISREKHYFHGNPLDAAFYSAVNTASWPNWQLGREYKVEYFAANGTTNLRTVETTWQQGVFLSGYAHNNPRIADETTKLVDTNQVSKKVYSYDDTVPYNSVSDIYEYDFGAGSPGSLLRHTHTDYLKTNPVNGVAYDTVNFVGGVPDINGTIHLRSRPTQEWISADLNGAIKKALNVYEYDNYSASVNFHAALQTYPRPNHTELDIVGLNPAFNSSSTNLSRGNITKTTRHLLNAAGSSIGSISSYTQYDVAGNAVKLIDPRSTTSNIIATSIDFADCFGGPNANARTNSAPSELNSVSRFSYAFPTVTTNALGQTGYAQYDYYLGMAVDIEDINGVVSSTYTESDALDRTKKIIRAANKDISLKSQILFDYDDANRIVTSTEDKETFADGALVSKRFYDGLGRTTETRQYEDATNYIAVRTEYDALGRPFKNSNPFRPPQESAIWTISLYEDAVGRLTKTTTPDNAIVTMSYSGNSTTVTDQTGKQSKTVTDARGRLKNVYEVPDDAAYNFLTTYNYDVLDNLTSVSQGSQNRTFQYDSLGRLVSANNAESGTITYQYDEVGNLLVRSDGRGVSAHFDYDALNRIKRRWYNASSNISDTVNNLPLLPSSVAQTNEANFYYDAQALPIEPQNYTRGASTGQLVAVTYGGSTSTTGDYYGYDAIGRNTQKTQRVDTKEYQLSTSYNAGNLPISVGYPSGHSVSYSYDSAARLLSFTGNLGGLSRNYSTEATYSTFGGLTKEKFGTSPATVYNKLYYNSRGQLAEIRVSTSWTGATDFSWNRGAIVNHYSDSCLGMCGGTNSTTAMTDNNGNLKKQDIYVPNHELIPTTDYVLRSQYFNYDKLNRLQWVRETMNSADQWRQWFSYDRYGNRTIDTSQDQGDPHTRTWGAVNNTAFATFDLASTNRLYAPGDEPPLPVANRRMQYDEVGNLKSDTYTGAGSRTYDAESKMTAATGGAPTASQSYKYDATGQRIKRTVNGTETWAVYGFNGEMVAEYPANGVAGSPQKEFGYRNGQLLITATTAAGWGAPPTIDDNPLNPVGQPQTDVKAIHITQLRAAIDAVRAHYSLPNYPWAKPVASGGTINTNVLISWEPIDEMRTALNQALGAPANGYAAGLTLGQPILAVHIQELRDRVLAAWITGSTADLRWFVTDQLGTPRIILDQSGSLTGIRRHDYLPFGEELFVGVSGRTTGQGYAADDGARQQFTQKERDTETNLDYFLARYYSNVQGRFTSVDPEHAGARTGDPQSWNGYGYARNSPLVYSDPDGREYLVCDAAGKNCTIVSDQQFQDERKAFKKDGNVYTGSGNFYEYGRIKNADGEVVATYVQFSIDDYQHRQLAAIAMAVDPIPMATVAFFGLSVVLGTGGGVIAYLAPSAPAFTTLGLARVGSAGAGIGGILSQLGRTDSRIIQKAIELGARGANSFADNLAKLSNAVSQIVPGGKVNVIGQIGNSQVYGSLVSGIGIAEVNGVTVIVKMANGNPQILGPLP